MKEDYLVDDEEYDYGQESKPLEDASAEANRSLNLTARLEDLSQDYTRQITSFKAKFIPSLTEDQLYLSEDPVLQQLEQFDGNALFAKAYNTMGDVIEGDQVHFATEVYQTKKVSDSGAFKQLKKELKGYLRKAEDMLADQLYDEKDEYGSLLAMGMVRANGLGDLSRMLVGHNSIYMAQRTPMADAVDGVAGTINSVMDAGYKERLKANESYYPLATIIIGAEKHLQTLSDYWLEQEKSLYAEGVPFDRDALYRQKLYDQARCLIPLIDKMSEATLDEEKRAKITASGLHSQGNEDPFHNSLFAARGALQLKCTLQAHVAGLENGWPIDDLGFLASFNFIRVSQRNACLQNTEAVKLEQFKKFDKPQYKDGQEEYLNRLDEIFDEIGKTSIKTIEDRNEAIEKIRQAIREGVEKDFLDKEKVKYFEQMYFNTTCRTYNARRLIGNPDYERTVQKDTFHDEVELDLSKPAFTKERSWIFFGRESNEHKRLREAADSLRQMEEDRRNPDRAEQISEEEYLNKLDEVIFLARAYRDKNRGARTPAGKKRLEGAERYGDYAEEQRRKLLEEKLDQLKEPGDKTPLDKMRIEAAGKTAEKAENELKSMQMLPTDPAGKQKCMEYAADILAYKFASSDVEVQQEAFKVKGFNNIKKDLLASSQFSRMMNEYFRNNVSPEDLVKDMRSDRGMGRLQDLHRQIKNEMENRRRQIADRVSKTARKNAAAEQKRNRREGGMGGL